MSTNIPAIEPAYSATVSASAGTGKTWLLVSRIIRLLLAGAEPASILAITFTRKAAAEMRQRLSQRLYVLATGSDAVLHNALSEINAPNDFNIRERARHLYESLLHDHYRINITTFHAFCQDVLRRFPLEADVPPGFDLIESTVDFEQAAWDLLFSESTQSPESELAINLDLLFDQCGSIYSTRSALDSFLNHRSDWWAYTDGQDNVRKFTLQRLMTFLDIDPHVSPLDTFFSADTIQQLTQFQDLLGLHPITKNEKVRSAIVTGLELYTEKELEKAFPLIESAFFNKDGEPSVRKESKIQKDKMGIEGESQFLKLNESIVERISKAKQALLKIANFKLNKAWYIVGSRLLSCYQTLKADQRVLDFADLEWKAYQLLNHSDHAQWIQYKLDMRINHLLIDEFQDTNPTQWHLIAPLLQELSGDNFDNESSVFIVGDTKQSIYRFRRADPELFNTAANWLAMHADAKAMPLSKSWRSSPIIIECVNKIFQHPELSTRILSFTTHSTHRADLWGQVEIMPLIEQEEDNPEQEINLNSHHFRNPLLQPRIILEDSRHYEEGRMIAVKIKQLIEGHTLVGTGHAAYPITYSDIIILLKQRTHSSAYEQALRDANIPYSGADRGTLLHCLEIRDIVALLEILVAPYNDLSLTSVLRSPIFDFTNSELIELACITKGSWIDRLMELARTGDKKYQNTYRMLHEWHHLSGAIPVHDLLDRIYSQAGIIQRYMTATPAHLQSRVKSNLLQFLELALEIDSGRYPSIGRFLARLQKFKNNAQGAPDEKAYSRDTDYVRIMTIHAAKGLEAPVVFIADSNNTFNMSHSYHAIVQWPPNNNKPDLMMLAGKKSTQDINTYQLLGGEALADQREDANLLYVALTRAKQCLFISGCKSRKQGSDSWYAIIKKQLAKSDEESAAGQSIVFNYGSASTKTPPVHHVENLFSKVVIEQGLSLPIKSDCNSTSTTPSNTLELISPTSRTKLDTEFVDSTLRGSMIHRLLQLLSNDVPEADACLQLCHEFHINYDDPLLKACLYECVNVTKKSAHKQLFDPSHYLHAYNEVPIQYQLNHKPVYGIIDRLVVSDSMIHLIDYKSHAELPSDLEKFAEQFQAQLNYYANGVKLLWPQLPLHVAVLFTHPNKLVTLKNA